MKQISIVHRPTGTLLAEGPRGWGITPFEGNYYIRRRYLRTDRFGRNYVPGLCPYKFLYVWLDLKLGDGSRSKLRRAPRRYRRAGYPRASRRRAALRPPRPSTLLLSSS